MTIKDESNATAMLAIQGLKTLAYLREQFDETLQDLKWLSAKFIEKDETRILASRSGYTGEDDMNYTFDINLQKRSSRYGAT